MWLVYTSIVLSGVAIVIFIWSAFKSIKGMMVTVKHLSEVAEKAREQGEAIKKEKEKLLQNVNGITDDVTNKRNIVQDVLNEGKFLVKSLKRYQ